MYNGISLKKKLPPFISGSSKYRSPKLMTQGRYGHFSHAMFDFVVV